jgi:hypothetical protein
VKTLLSLPVPNAKKGERFLALATATMQKQFNGNTKPQPGCVMALQPDLKARGKAVQCEPHGTALPAVLSGAMDAVFTQLFTVLTKRKVGKDRRDIFASSAGKESVKCYRHVNDGVLFPLADGCLFLRPFVFVHRDEMEGLSLAKSGTGRVFSLNIDTEGEPVEFSQIEKEEEAAFSAYLQQVVKLNAREVKAENTQAKREAKAKAKAGGASGSGASGSGGSGSGASGSTVASGGAAGGGAEGGEGRALSGRGGTDTAAAATAEQEEGSDADSSDRSSDDDFGSGDGRGSDDSGSESDSSSGASGDSDGDAEYDEEGDEGEEGEEGEEEEGGGDSDTEDDEPSGKKRKVGA